MSKRINLSARNLQVLDCIIPEYRRSCDSALMIARRLDISKVQVMRSLVSLNRKGLVLMEQDGSYVEASAKLRGADVNYSIAFGLCEVRV